MDCEVTFELTRERLMVSVSLAARRRTPSSVMLRKRSRITLNASIWAHGEGTGRVTD